LGDTWSSFLFLRLASPFGISIGSSVWQVMTPVAIVKNTSLLRRVADGDKHAMRECLDRYGGLVWSLSRSFTKSIADAEDATQDVFVHLWRKAGHYDPQFGEEVQFVSVLTRRRLIDWVRAHVRNDDHLHATLREGQLAAHAARVDLDEEAKLAWTAVSQLVVEQQSVVLLAVVHGMTHEQIARHLQMPLGTVKSNLYRGLASVRDTTMKHRDTVLARPVRDGRVV